MSLSLKVYTSVTLESVTRKVDYKHGKTWEVLGRFGKTWEDLGSREDLGRLRKFGKIWEG